MSSLFSSSREPPGIVLERYISSSAAAQYSGFCRQYRRRLLSSERLTGTKGVQIYERDLDTFAVYLESALTAENNQIAHCLRWVFTGWRSAV